MLDSCVDHGKNGSAAGYAQRMVKYKNYYLHRIALATKLGVEVWDLTGLALHRCHNPRCINPDHLYLGTQQDNMDDKVLAGRQYNQQGENSPGNILTQVDVDYIRAHYVPRCPMFGGVALAAKFNVHKVTISNIVRRVTWL